MLKIYMYSDSKKSQEVRKTQTQNLFSNIYGSFSLKLDKIVTQRVKIQSVNFLMLLFGNESLTSLVYINIRHKLTG